MANLVERCIYRSAIFPLLLCAALFATPSSATARDPLLTTSPAAEAAPRETLAALIRSDLESLDKAPEKRAVDPSLRSAANRALRLLERLDPVAGRETASYFLTQYNRGLPDRYYYTACTAVYLIGKAAAATGLNGEERLELKKLAKAFDVGTLPGLAAAVLEEDRIRGLTPAKQAREIRRFWGGSAGRMAGYLLLHGYQVPESLQDFWERGERWQHYRKRNYEGLAGDHYFRFRAMKFPSTQAEMVFLWERIRAQYARSARPGPGVRPDDLEVYPFEEARAATARLIEIGPPVVPFLLARKERILRASAPEDPRSTTGDLYEIWIMRTLLDASFAPLLRQLSQCGSPKVEKAARDGLDRLERGDPYPYRALFVFQFGMPMGA